jgi:hypothetical protein
MSQKFYFNGVDLNDMIDNASSSSNTISNYYTNLPGSTTNTQNMETAPSGFNSSEGGTTFSKYIHKNTYFCYDTDEEYEAPPFKIDNENVFSKNFATNTTTHSNRIIVHNTEVTQIGSTTVNIPNWCNAIKLYFVSKEGSAGDYGSAGYASQNYSDVTNNSQNNSDHYYQQNSRYNRSRNHRHHKSNNHNNKNYNLFSGAGGSGGKGVVMFFYKYIKFAPMSGNQIDVNISDDDGGANNATLKHAQDGDLYTWEWGNGSKGGSGTSYTLDTNNADSVARYHHNYDGSRNNTNYNRTRHNSNVRVRHNNVDDTHTQQCKQGVTGSTGSDGIFNDDSHPHYVKYFNSSITTNSVKIFFFKYDENAVIPGSDEPDYELECLVPNSTMNVVDSNGNKFLLNGETSYNADRKYGLTAGVYIIKGVPSAHPMALVNSSATINGNITYTGDTNNKSTKTVDGTPYDFYYGDVTITVLDNFGTISLYCYYHGYMGGEDLLIFNFFCPAPPQIQCLVGESAMNVINNNGNKFLLNGETSYNDRRKYGLTIGVYKITGVPTSHPVAIINATSYITYTGDTNNKFTKTVDSTSYDFYHGDITITINADFGTASLYCYYHGYMGGEDLLTFSSLCPSPPQIQCLDPSGNMNVVDSNGNKFLLNGETSYNQYRKYGLTYGVYIIKGVPTSHPVAIINATSYITYTGDTNNKFTKTVDSTSYDFYHGDITITIDADFGTASLYCYYHGYMGGEDLLTFSIVCPSPPVIIVQPPEPDAISTEYYIKVIEDDWQEGTGINSFVLDPLPDNFETTGVTFPPSSGHGVYTFTNAATTGGSGTGATVNFSTDGNGEIRIITINNIGSGYAVGDIITATPTGSTRFTDDFDLSPITDLSGGTGIGGTLTRAIYGHGASLTVNGMATTGGTGSGATVNVTTNATGDINSLAINNIGSGYSRGDVLTVTGSSGINSFRANLVVTGIGGALSPVRVGGHTPNTTVNGMTITGGSGSGATVNVTTDGNGKIITCVIASTGSGYNAGDIVTVTGSGGINSFVLDPLPGHLTDSQISFPNPTYQQINFIHHVGAGNDPKTTYIAANHQYGIVYVTNNPSNQHECSSCPDYFINTVNGYTVTTDRQDQNAYWAWNVSFHAYRFEAVPMNTRSTTVNQMATTGGSGSGATVNVTTNSEGGITSVKSSGSGSGYNAGDVITVTGSGGINTFTLSPYPGYLADIGSSVLPTNIGGHGVSLSVNGMATTGGGAGATVNVTTDANGAINSVAINNIGSGYNLNDVVTVTGSSGINSFTLNPITGVSIVATSLQLTGKYGSSFETLTTTGGSGSGATAFVIVSNNGTVGAVSLFNAGSGYSVGDVLTVRSGLLKFYVFADDLYTELLEPDDIQLIPAEDITFIQSHSSNTNHPLAITSGATYSSATTLSTSTTAADGTITTTYTPSTGLSYVYLNCQNHSNMGSFYNGTTGMEVLLGGGDAAPEEEPEGDPPDGY